MNIPLFGRIVMVGPSPTRDGNPNAPLSGKSSHGTGVCLLRMLQMDSDTFERSFDLYNLLPYHMGRHQGGDRFPECLARQSADRLSKKLQGRSVVLVGKKVARAFGIDHVPPFVWVEKDGVSLAWVENPSMMNRYWNTPENRRAGNAFLATLGNQAFTTALREKVA